MASKHKLGRLALSVLAATAVLASAACGSSSARPERVPPPLTAGTPRARSTMSRARTSGSVAAIIRSGTTPSEREGLADRVSESADEQRAAMIKNAESKGASNYDVLSVDVVWTAEFAANGYLAEMANVDTSGYLKAAVDSGTYFNKLYAFPSTSDGAMLYYRKDLLTAAGITAAPKTWDEMKAACAAVKAKGVTIDCYGGQFQKYEGLTCNFSEMVNSAGGEFLSADGKPTVNSEKAVAGVKWAVDAFTDGTIPKAALTWKEEESRKYFQDGKLLFLRQWPYVYSLANKTDGSSAIAGKFGVAPIPGLTGPGVSTLGGHNMGISKFTKNKGTALAFVKWWNSAENQKANTIPTSCSPQICAVQRPRADNGSTCRSSRRRSTTRRPAEGRQVRRRDPGDQDAAYGAQRDRSWPWTPCRRSSRASSSSASLYCWRGR